MQSAKSLCEEWNVEIERRVRRRKRMPGELAQDAGLSAEEEIVRIMKSVHDRIQQEIKSRFTRLQELNDKFGFLLDVETLLIDNDHSQLLRNCLNLGVFYITDINGNDLCNEIIDCKMLLATRIENSPKTPLELLTFIISYGEDVFPNFRIAIQILLTIAVSIASCERSFF